MPKLLPAGDPWTWTMSTIGILILNATNILLALAGVVAAIFIVLGAFNYLMAYGDETKAEKGKKTLTWAIVGLVFIIVGRLVLGEVWGLVSTDTTLPPITDTEGNTITVPTQTPAAPAPATTPAPATPAGTTTAAPAATTTK